jgi:hypothetical protein
MSDISDLRGEDLPSERSLLKATLVAVLIAVALLLIAILPAEYGIDPTGAGRALGLTSLSKSDAATPAVAQTEITTLEKRDTPFRNDEMGVQLFPGQGAEIKAVMAEGDHFNFNWSVEGGAVSFDMHGQLADAAEDDFTSYELGQAQSEASGSFRAPFAGHHGWYWQNDGSEPVIVKLKTSGFYETLYMP